MTDYPSPYQPPSYQPNPRLQQPTEKPGVWTWYVVFPLLIFWINDRTKKFFGM